MAEKGVYAGVDVVVATPGKLLHLADSGKLALNLISYLVVDESDRFMQGSMEEELRKACSNVEYYASTQ